MVSSSRIIGADQVTDIRAFKLDELRQDKGAAGHQPRHRLREDEGPPPGYREGFKRGLEEGMRRGAELAHQRLLREQGARLQAVADEFAQRNARLHEAMDAALAQVREELAGQAIELALELARQFLRIQPQQDRASIDAVVREAVASLVDERAGFNLHLHPDDAELIGPLLEPMLQARGARLVPDPRIAAGGCRILSAGAEVDATNPTRWRRVLQAIGQKPGPHDETGAS